MKSFTTAFFILAVTVVGTVVYLNPQKTPTISAPGAASLPERPVQSSSEKNVVSEPQTPRSIPAGMSESIPAPAASPVLTDSNPAGAPTALSQTVDALVSA